MTKKETKIRVLAVLHILIRRAATVKEIQEELAVRYGIRTDRKTVYDDILAINKFHHVAYEGYAGGWRYSIKKGGKKPGGERK